jgi:hypothetical protein
MQKFLVVLMVASAGYFLWQFSLSNPKMVRNALPIVAAANWLTSATPAEQASAGAESSSPAEIEEAPAQFISRIRITESPETVGGKMPPGRFLVLERVSLRTKNGVLAIVPGDTVRLVSKRRDGKWEVTDGTAQYIVRQSQLTQDIVAGQEAERQDWEMRRRLRGHKPSNLRSVEAID